MMRNDLPYAPPVNGRWYKIFIEIDGLEFKITTSDIECSFDKRNSPMILIDKKYKMLTYIIDATLNTTGNVFCGTIYHNGQCGIMFNSDTSDFAIDNFTIYAYCVRS